MQIIHATKRFQVEQHLQTALHRSGVERKTKRQTLVTNMGQEAVQGTKLFNVDLCRALVSANIPLKKLDNPAFKSFLQKYTSNHIPDESTLRKNYLAGLYTQTIEGIRQTLANDLIWVSVDETTDVAGRYVANVIVGAMRPTESSKPYLLTSEVLEQTNHHTIARLFSESLTLLWPNGVKHDNVLLFVSDAAAYMVKAATGLKVLYPKMIHVTCLAHASHRVAETVRAFYPEVDRLISAVKKVFCKAPSRVRKFHEVAPGIPLPPEPIITRWGTWINAAAYYAIHFNEVQTVLQQLQEEDAASITVAQLQFRKNGIREQLTYINTWFQKLSDTITELEDSNLPLHRSVSIVLGLQRNLRDAPGDGAKAASQKMEKVLHKNDGFQKLVKIVEILEGRANIENTFSGDENYSPADISAYNFAPIVSCDVERSFSRYKALLSDNRRSFTFENLKMYYIVYSNNSDVAID